MDEEEANNIDPNYVKHFQNHVARISDHVSGVDTTHGPSHPSYFPQTGFWTSEDKNLFFHALSVHSRLRPDLIAAEIPGKSVVDVCVYLDLLADAAAKEPHKWGRLTFQPAMEVSDEWVQFEVMQAEAMAVNGEAWEEGDRVERRTNAIRDERLVLRNQQNKRTSKGRDREEERQRNLILKEFQAKQDAQWQKEDYMRELCGVHMKVIDGILREAEESSEPTLPNGGPQPPSVAASEAVDFVPESAIDPVLPAMSGPPSTQRPSTTTVVQQLSGIPSCPSTVSAQTFPTPLQRVVPTNQLIVASPGHDVSEDAPNVSPADDMDDVSNLSPCSRRRHQKRLYMRRKRAERSGGVVSAALTRLKPGRKTNKTRERALARKRAQEAEVVRQEEQMEEDLNLGKAAFTIQEEDEKEEYIDLHAGKEEFEVSLESERKAWTSRAGSVDDSEHEEGSAAIFSPHIGGITHPYKVREELSSFGYDAVRLDSDGLGLFHLTALGKLMSLNASLQEVPDSVGTCISASSIKLLHAEVMCFLTDLIFRTITVHDQERMSKGRTKVWRLRDNQIRASTVHQAVEMMDAARDKKDHFRSLISRLSSLNETVKQMTTRLSREKVNAKGNSLEEGQEPDRVYEDAIESAAEEDLYETKEMTQSSVYYPELQLPIYREINMPFVWHYSPCRKSLLNSDEDENTLLPDVIDANALLDELLEEEEVDVDDVEAAKHAEAELWARFNGSQGANGSALPLETRCQWGMQTRKADILRLRFGQPRGVKSSILVEDVI